MWKISIHPSPVIYLKNRLHLQDSSSKFLIMIYQSLCRPQKTFFLKVQHHGLKGLSQLTNIIHKENIGLYHDDGLSIF